MKLYQKTDGAALKHKLPSRNIEHSNSIGVRLRKLWRNAGLTD